MLTRPLLRALLAVCLLAPAACDRNIKVSDEDIKQIQYKDMVTMMQNKPRNKSLFDVLGKGNEATVVLDPRPAKKFEQGHIPGAVNIPLPQIVAGHKDLAEAKNIIVYGTGWMDYSSPAAAKRLMAVGYHNVFDFRGGLELWKSEGGRVESAAAATQPVDGGK
ncbi:MAG: rhodanese-like domain-containing protein [Planctomycetes bacterium]|nr:rhodanese-like domain-containing protein [Planctomycetota bacterium]